MIIMTEELWRQCSSVIFFSGIAAVIMIYYVIKVLSAFFAWLRIRYRLMRYGAYSLEIVKEIYDFAEIGGISSEKAEGIETALLYYDRKHKKKRVRTGES